MNKLKIIPFFFLAVLLLLTACSSKQGTGETGEEVEYLSLKRNYNMELNGEKNIAQSFL